MRNNVLSYFQMCNQERLSLQAGMNFRPHPQYSVLLMSTRSDAAQYDDGWDVERGLLIYEGHNARKSADGPDPATIDQPLKYASGRPTQNGLFFSAAKLAASGEGPTHIVRVYEKLRKGLWSDRGMFLLIDAEMVERAGRKVCLFYLQPGDGTGENNGIGVG